MSDTVQNTNEKKSFTAVPLDRDGFKMTIRAGRARFAIITISGRHSVDNQVGCTFNTTLFEDRIGLGGMLILTEKALKGKPARYTFAWKKDMEVCISIRKCGKIFFDVISKREVGDMRLMIPLTMDDVRAIRDALSGAKKHLEGSE